MHVLTWRCWGQQALQDNNVPHVDHGIEVLYRFGNFSPFEVRRAAAFRARRVDPMTSLKLFALGLSLLASSNAEDSLFRNEPRPRAV
jgi:hypothetical protein